jgi:DNA helicase-4
LTNNAAEEIDERLNERFGITGVEVQTIHSFSLWILTELIDEDPTIINPDDRENFVDRSIREMIDEDPIFNWHYRQFLANFTASVPDPSSYEERADYIEERLDRTYETLAGEEVASQGEKAIADFLFTRCVDYQYESIFTAADTAADKDAYRPDFYLPAYDIYIEHWGIDERGEVAPWFSWSTETYRQKLFWAREQFRRVDQRLVETYDFEDSAGRLERALATRLRQQGVELEPMEFDELVEYVTDEHERTRAIQDRFVDFVDNAGTFDISPANVRERLTPMDPRTYHFGRCGTILLQQYEEWKRRNEYVDFDDMIHRAFEVVREDPDRAQSAIDHLLVDEFQDVSIGQIRLFQSLCTTGESPPRLFCVGDDWQSIYGFRGALVDYFVDFQSHFGPGSTTRLTRTYRLPEPILQASTSLISHNSNQIDKTPEAVFAEGTKPKSHPLDEADDAVYAERAGEYAAELVEDYLESGSAPGEVMVLSRYDRGSSYVGEVMAELEDRAIPYDGKETSFRPVSSDQYSDLTEGISVFSAHQAKGREANHVILVNVCQGDDGFSPETRTDELQKMVRDVAVDESAEERRLFYVALTRSKETVDLLTRIGYESPFLDEIDQHVTRVSSAARYGSRGSVGDCITIEATIHRLWEETHESQRQAGLIEDSVGRIKFVAWNRTDPPPVVQGCRYELTDVELVEFEGRREIHFTEETTADILEVVDPP